MSNTGLWQELQQVSVPCGEVKLPCVMGTSCMYPVICCSSSGLLQNGIQRDVEQDTCWDRGRGLNPHPRALCSAHALSLAVS